MRGIFIGSSRTRTGRQVAKGMFTGNIAIVSTEKFSGDRIFEPDLARDNVLERFKLLRHQLRSMGSTCHTVDKFAARDIDVLIFHDIMNELDIILAIVKANPAVCLVYIPNEPDFVVPLHNEKVLPGLPVDLLLTWNDRIVGRFEHVRKQNIGQPVIKPDEIPAIPFADRKFISSIFAYKPPGVTGTLFDERLNAVEFFSQQAEGMDLFGVGWEASEQPFVKASYRGRCERKIEIQKQYKFSIAFENCGTMPGLITEKIFDCFAAGTVPVYLGAPNVAEYIPSSCYVDFRAFGTYMDLYDYLVHMPEQRYQEYLDAVSEFLDSPQYYSFTSACYAENLSREIGELANSQDARSLFQVKWVLARLTLFHPGIWRHWRRFRRFLTSLLFTW